MEDAHISEIEFDKDTSLFAVFDGHGGSQVSKLCQKNFINFLIQNENYKSENFEQALKDTF